MTNEKRKDLAEIAAKRAGETRINNYGSLMTIDKYVNNTTVFVRFIDTGYVTVASYNNFLTGSVKSPYDKSVYGVGYTGLGKYKVSDENGKQTPAYATWRRMLERAYSSKYHESKPTYKDVSVCEEWHDFQNFAEWYHKNYYEIDGQQIHLDKDILVKNSKIYSPDTCIFVPASVNTLFNKRAASRGNLPIGVTYLESMKKYKAACSFGNNNLVTQLCDNPYEAFDCYKLFKETRIKQVADEFRDYIPEKLYNAMITYIVEITD